MHAQLHTRACSLTLTPVIQSTPSCAPTHLDVLPTADPAVAAPVKLAHVGEDHSLGRHI